MESQRHTLELDEIDLLKPDMQAKLLHALEKRDSRIAAGNSTNGVNCRVIASSNEDLAARVRMGAFRKDLYYHLSIFPIEVPPLRERKCDIPLLADFFASRAWSRRGLEKPEGAGWISSDAAQVLNAHEWPGNVRELRNAIYRAYILSPKCPISSAVIRWIISSPALLETAARADLHLRRGGDALECQLIVEAMIRTGYRKREACALLGIDPKNLSYYLRKHGVDFCLHEGV